jgi:hypothetical protein
VETHFDQSEPRRLPQVNLIKKSGGNGSLPVKI